MSYDVHVYPVFKIKVQGLQGSPEYAVTMAEAAVSSAVNDLNMDLTLSVLGGCQQGNMSFAEDFGCSVVDVFGHLYPKSDQHEASPADGKESDKRMHDSFDCSQRKSEAARHAAALDSLIDGEHDELSAVLGPVKAFLETVR